MTAAHEVKQALHRRYNKPSQGRDGEQWVCIEEARSGAGFDGNKGQCDFLAVNTWRSRGLELIGHEVKVSMSDWKSELASPEKAERFARFCRRWYVVVPSELASKIQDEVPPAWGLLSMSAAGRLTERQKAAKREPVDPVPAWWWVGWLAQIDRQHKRSLPSRVESLVAEERRRMREDRDASISRTVELRVAGLRTQLEKRDANIAALREMGLDLDRMPEYQMQHLAEVWTAARGGVKLTALGVQLRKAIELVDVLTGDDE